MSNREIEVTLDGVPFFVNYTPSTDQMEQTAIKRADFEFTLNNSDEDDEDELTDREKAKAWIDKGFENINLIDFLIPDYKAFLKLFKVNALSIDAAYFRLNATYFNCDDDQAFTIDANKAVGFTVNGRKYLEKTLG